ncbi:TPA: dihydrofolate reductase, partial [Escherichia coli]|nr:dihydrofolate reductase [Escherichia coli]
VIMITACVAIDSDGGFGAQGTLPWAIPEEFAFYQEHVRGGICIIGGRSFNDLVHLSLSPKGGLYKKCLLRTTPHIVVSSSHELVYDPSIMALIEADRRHLDLYFVNTVDAAVKLAKGLGGMHANKDIHFIGGKRIYDAGLDYCDEVYTSILPAVYLNCDTFFPVEKLSRMFTPELYKTIPNQVHADIPVIKWTRKRA